MTDLDFINAELMRVLPPKERLEGYFSITEEFEDQRTQIETTKKAFQLVSIIAPKCELVNKSDTGLDATGVRRVFFSGDEIKKAKNDNVDKLNLFARIMKERDLFIKDLLNHYGDLSNVEVDYYQLIKKEPLQFLESLNVYELRFVSRRV